MEIFVEFGNELWHIMQELSPWLLLGLLLAGVLHVILPGGFIHRHLGGSRFGNVFKAVAVGVPMPLCSCGVIPTALGLKKDGASNGAATGFLISTPQTGVDSILVSATFLGWPFAVFKVVSALVSGLIGGLLVNSWAPNHSTIHSPSPSNAPFDNKNKYSWGEIINFGIVKLLKDIYRWLIVGIIIAALIGTFIDQDKLKSIPLTQGLTGMIIMLLISLPMYVCATASVPLAASLVTAGMSPGSALVFLMAGPTTNVATMGAIYRGFGKKVLAIYLATVIIMSISLGMVFDGLLTNIPAATKHMHALPSWLNAAAALLLAALLITYAASDLYQRLRPKKTPPPCCTTESPSLPPIPSSPSPCCRHKAAPTTCCGNDQG